MNEEHKNWCTCAGHDAEDWTVRNECYARHFIPKTWALEYHSLPEHEEGRTLYMLGSCTCCGGFMRSGVALALNISGDRFLADVYREMTRFRPFDGNDKEKGLYFSCVGQRAEWYQQQDDMTLIDCNKQFLNLFHTEDQETVGKWLARNHFEESHIYPRRDRKSTLLQHILETARTDGAIAEAEEILYYTLSGGYEPPRPKDNTYLTDYRFDVIPRLMFGQEGVFLDLYLEGSFDSSNDKRTIIGTFKTLRTDQEACRLMGGLGGTLMFYAREYVNREIHRYTPTKQLKRQEGVS